MPEATQTHSLTSFGLQDLVSCSTVLRQLGKDAHSIEEAAERTVRWLYDHLIDDNGQRACALVRLFWTRPARELTPELIRAAGLPQPPPPVTCLVLLATAGQESAWNSPVHSVNHRAIVLSNPEAVGRAPMIAELLGQFGVNVPALLDGDRSLLLERGHRTTFNVFHVPEAAGSPWVPAQQDFVLRYGIRSVLGFGGILPSGSLFVLILFSKAAIPRATADQFKTLALSVKLSLLPLAAGYSKPRLSAARGAALEELLGVHEEAVMEQSIRLERALSDLRQVNAELSERVRARTTELCEANHALMEQIERWRVTLASIDDGIIVTDGQGAIVTLNPAAEQLTGWSVCEAAGRNLEDVFAAVVENTGAGAPNPAARVLKEGAIAHMENHTLLVSRDGRQHPIDGSAAPMVDPAGKTLGVVLVFRDVSERRQMERYREDALERERDARRRMEALNRAKDDFLSILSHELRTPLTAIAGWTALLRAGQLDAEGTRKAIEVIERNVGMQTRLITDLLDVSAILAGKLTLDKRPVDLWDVAYKATESLQPAALAAGIGLWMAGPSGGLVVEGDTQRLHQIVHNLISNAIKFTKPGGNVRVSLSREGGRAAVTVQDTGIGIESDFLPHIFSRFSQADSTMSRRYQGLGLGLSIVRHLAELHGGSAEARSAGAGRGSTFIVSLPLALPKGAPVEEPSLAANQVRPHIGARLDDLRILVIEDDADAGELIAETLERCGATVASAADAEHALAELDRFRPNIIIGDIGLPGMNGFDLMRLIRERDPEHSGAIPAIALTAYVRPEDRARALESGYQMHLSKPVDLAALTATVRQLALSTKAS